MGTIGRSPGFVNRIQRTSAGVLLAFVVLSLAWQAADIRAQSRVQISEARVRGLARDAARASKGDPTELVLALDESVRTRYGDFEPFPISVVRGQDIQVLVTAPFMAYRRSLIDLLRTRRPIDEARWTGAVVVSIEPLRLDAPDVEQLRLTRNGTVLQPVGNALKPMTFSNGAGEQRAVHAGTVQFAVDSFEPGAEVVLQLLPRGLEPLTYAFSEAELETLR